jgi:hypothetical protein
LAELAELAELADSLAADRTADFNNSPDSEALKEGLMAPLHWMKPEFWDDKRWLFTDVHDVMTSMRYHGKPLPEGMSEELLLDVNKAVRAVCQCA